MDKEKRIMNLKEFKELVDWHYDQYKDQAEELTVVVEIAEPSVGSSAFSKVRSISKGFDWDNWKISIYTEEPLVRKTNKKQLKITQEETAFKKDLIATLEKYQPERSSKLILEVFKTIEKHHGKKRNKKGSV